MNEEITAGMIKDLLLHIGENPDREGLQDTPARVARMYNELLTYNHPKPKLTVFNNTENYDQMIFDKTYFYSFCEHHFIPFFGNTFIETGDSYEDQDDYNDRDEEDEE